MELRGKKFALLVADVYQELEVWYPLLRLQEAGAEVVAIGPKAGETYKSKLGYPVLAQQAFDDVSATQFDGVIVPGGFAPDHIRRYPKAIQFVKDVDASGKLVAAICHGPWVLCSAGVLRDKRATCFFAIKDDVINAGAEYEDSEVVVDGNLVTSRKPEDLPAFMKACFQVVTEGVPVSA